MKKMIAAIALAIALPAAANAQAPQAPAKPGCCAGMKEKCACCKGISEAGHQMSGAGHSGQGHAAGHAGHDAPQPDGKAAPEDSHQNHQR